MAQIIAIVNQKGGVGKTTTAINLSASLAAAEHKVLLIDLDPQSNASSGVGINGSKAGAGIYQALLGELSINQAVADTELECLKVVPSSEELAGAEIELVSMEEREQRLKKTLAGLKGGFEFIIIDCPPSLSLLTINALAAAHSVLVPLQCEYYALEGLGRLLRTIQLVRERLNPNLKIDGIILTMFDKRNNLSWQVKEEIRKHFPDQAYKTMIPRNVRLGEAPSFGKPIILYDINSSGAQSYMELAREFLKRKAKR